MPTTTPDLVVQATVPVQQAAPGLIQLMSVPDLIQLIGVIVSLVVILNELIDKIREWRGGSPELRLLRYQLQTTNDQHLAVLRDILKRLE